MITAFNIEIYVIYTYHTIIYLYVLHYILQHQFAIAQFTVEENQLVMICYLMSNVVLNYLVYHLLHLDNVCYVNNQVI